MITIQHWRIVTLNQSNEGNEVETTQDLLARVGEEVGSDRCMLSLNDHMFQLSRADLSELRDMMSETLATKRK